MTPSALPNGIANPSCFSKKPSLLTVPQEILLHIVKQLPTVLDIFILRQACWSLYNRLGPSNGHLYYHFLNNVRNRSHSRRFSHYQKDIDYFALTKDILAGKITGCGICLVDLKPTAAVVAYRGGIFYKRLCKICVRANFKELWRLEDEYPGLKIHPNIRITWDGSYPFEDAGYATGRWLSGAKYMESIRAVDLQAAITEQLPPPPSSSTTPTSRRNLGREAWEARYDKQILFAHKKKESADVVVKIMTEEFDKAYPQLHWLQSSEDFSEYLYNSLLWNLRPWLAPHHGNKALPKFTLGDRMEELLEIYTESEELLPQLRMKSLRLACKDVLAKELLKIPQPGQKVGRSRRTSPLIKYWLEDWLQRRGYKIPKGEKRDLRNTARYCPFCWEEKIAARYGSTGVLSVHVWCAHTEKLEEEWKWIPEVHTSDGEPRPAP